MEEQWVAIWNLINTGGVIALLFVNLFFLLRGDILPRKVYEKLTAHMLDEMSRQILEGIRAIIFEGIRAVIREELARKSRTDDSP